MAESEERVEGAEKYWDGGKNDTIRKRSRNERIPLLYKQLKARNRAVQPCSAWTLECREYALAFGCNLP